MDSQSPRVVRPILNRLSTTLIPKPGRFLGSVIALGVLTLIPTPGSSSSQVLALDTDVSGQATTQADFLNQYPPDVSAAQLDVVATNYAIYCSPEEAPTVEKPACAGGVGEGEFVQEPAFRPDPTPANETDVLEKPIVLYQYDKATLFQAR
jgi:hypothetical protein